MADRNQPSEIQRDIEFLQELKTDLEVGCNGDPVRLQALSEKLEHWIDELSQK